MRYLYAYQYKGKRKQIPLYMDGPFWSIWGYRIFGGIMGWFMDISLWFQRYSKETK